MTRSQSGIARLVSIKQRFMSMRERHCRDPISAGPSAGSAIGPRETGMPLCLPPTAPIGSLGTTTVRPRQDADRLTPAGPSAPRRTICCRETLATLRKPMAMPPLRFACPQASQYPRESQVDPRIPEGRSAPAPAPSSSSAATTLSGRRTVPAGHVHHQSLARSKLRATRPSIDALQHPHAQPAPL